MSSNESSKTPAPYQWAGAANSPQLQADGSRRFLPQLVMGWVKRVLDQINLYEARYSATFSGSAPATYSSLLQAAGAPYNGAVAELVIARLFVLHYICGFLALLHLGAEWMYSGKEPPRFSAWLVGGALALSLVGGIWLQPKLKEWHRIKYAEHYRLAKTPPERAAAAKSFGMWHGISMGMNLLTLAALWLNLARIIHPGEAPRFVSPVNKFGLDRRS